MFRNPNDHAPHRAGDEEENALKQELKNYKNVTMGRGTICLKQCCCLNERRRVGNPATAATSPLTSIILYFLCFITGLMVQRYVQDCNDLDWFQAQLSSPTLRSSSGSSIDTTTTESYDSSIDYPQSVKTIVINIGSNLDPILPHDQFGPCARAIAVEPMVGCKIPTHPQLDVLHTAVSNKEALATLKFYNRDGRSSSFAKPASDSFWNSNNARGDGKRVLVPMVSLTLLLQSIPSHVHIAILKTDMQGFDFLSVSSAGEALKDRVAILQTEVWLEDTYTYEAENDLCRDWFPFMTSLGYVVRTTNCDRTHDSIQLECQTRLQQNPIRPKASESAGLKECDITWGLTTISNSHNPTTTTATLSDPSTLYKVFDPKPTFTKQQYATCT